MDEIEVSIICNTYNHEKYIKYALDSFIMQKTSFKYEVLIHDDASTDNTAKIINEYEKKYPDIIKPIYQKTNQYSLGIPIIFTYQLPRARGKYIAFCEGDDFWIDEGKLQMQYDLLETMDDINLCAHNVIVQDFNGKVIRNIAPSKKDCILSFSKILLGGGGYFGTNSLFIRKKVFDISFFEKSKFAGDVAVQAISSYDNGAYYFSKAMSVYRFNVPGSFTNSSLKNIDILNNFCRKTICFLEDLNKYSSFKYDDVIKRTINIYEYKIMNNTFYKVKENRKKAFKRLYFKEKNRYRLSSFKHFLKDIFSFKK